MKRILTAFTTVALTSAAALAQPGFEVLWQVQSERGFSAPNLLLNGEVGGAPRIVVSETGTGVSCFDLEGQRLWSHAMAPPVTAAPAVADVTGDGREEVVAADSKGTLTVLTSDGTPLWSTRLSGDVNADSCPAVVDLNEDGRPEIVVGDASGTVSCLDNSGAVLWRFSGDGTTMGPILAADLYDGPGKEIIVTSHDRHVYALNAAGEWIWDLHFPTDLFPNTLPILADTDGNGAPELYIGGGLHHFYRIDLGNPSVTFEENVYLHVNGAIDAADLDGDGKDEVVFGNKGSAIWCYGDGGFRWKRELQTGSLVAAPVFLNLDADPRVEVLFFTSEGQVHGLDAEGADLFRAQLPPRPIARPLVGDLLPENGTEIVVTAAGGFHGNGIMAMARLNVPYLEDPRNRTVFAQDRAHTGRPAGSREYTMLPTPTQNPGSSQASVEAAEMPVVLSGPNTWRFDIANPGRERLTFLTELRYPNGAVQRFARHVTGTQDRPAVTFAVADAGRYRFAQRLVAADAGTLIHTEEQDLEYAGFESDRAYLEQEVFPETRAALEAWHKENPSCAGAIANQMDLLRGRLAQLAENETPERPGRLASLRDSARRLCHLAVAGQALAGPKSFMVWEFSPWAYFDGRATLPDPAEHTERMAASLCVGEYESLAVNITNPSDRTLRIRVSCTESGDIETGAAAHVAFRQAVSVPNLHRDLVADALPKLDEAGSLTVAPFESAQVWITVDAAILDPGHYELQVRFKSIEPDPTEVTLPLAITVHDLALPRPRPLRMCVWSSEGGDLGTQKDVVLRDLVSHGVTVFLAPPPKATFDEHGNLVGAPDFTQHDEAVRRLSRHGLLLFLSPQGQVAGPPFLSEPWKRAFITYLRAWSAHMKELGLGYAAWGLYPYDEPSAPFSETTQNLVAVATVVREADPEILIYTDPTSGTTMESVKMLTGLIDIWQPSSELLERLGPELIPEAKRVGKEVWFYDAAGGAKTLSCLGMYRHRYWFAWQQGFTGVGWWVYATHGPDRWDGPNAFGDFFATVYDGPEGPVPSKRWEAAREGVEDYEYLCLLRDAIRSAEAAGISTEILAEARQLLKELPDEVERNLRETGRRLPLTPDRVQIYKQVTDSIREARRRIVETCLALKPRQ